MTDYIRREDAQKALFAPEMCYAPVQVKIIRELPAADVAEVVRCEGCKHSYTKNRPCDTALFRWCRKWDNIVRDCDFCSYGEYRTNSGGNEHE